MATAGAIAWAAGSCAPGRQLDILAVLIGLATGLAAARRARPEPRLQAAAAALAAVGCAARTLAAMIAIPVARYQATLAGILAHPLRAYPGTVGCPGLLAWAPAAARPA